mmetsp:Transcript_16408/g.45481  ORF Transcript_16408/g.45481 Transcript_16408/m.45481 type:complete len:225 (-) Transcript_16408:16-690(-)
MPQWCGVVFGRLHVFVDGSEEGLRCCPFQAIGVVRRRYLKRLRDALADVVHVGALLVLLLLAPLCFRLLSLRWRFRLVRLCPWGGLRRALVLAAWFDYFNFGDHLGDSFGGTNVVVVGNSFGNSLIGVIFIHLHQIILLLDSCLLYLRRSFLELFFCRFALQLLPLVVRYLNSLRLSFLAVEAKSLCKRKSTPIDATENWHRLRATVHVGALQFEGVHCEQVAK